MDQDNELPGPADSVAHLAKALTFQVEAMQRIAKALEEIAYSMRPQVVMQDIRLDDTLKELRPKLERMAVAVSKKKAGPPRSTSVWAVYSENYKRRWGAEPPRNAQANAMLCKLIDRLGLHMAERCAAWYPMHPDAMYVRAKHPISLLLRDAERIAVEVQTGRVGTAKEAQQSDSRAANMSAAAQYLMEEK